MGSLWGTSWRRAPSSSSVARPGRRSSRTRRGTAIPPYAGRLTGGTDDAAAAGRALECDGPAAGVASIPVDADGLLDGANDPAGALQQLFDQR